MIADPANHRRVIRSRRRPPPKMTGSSPVLYGDSLPRPLPTSLRSRHGRGHGARRSRSATASGHRRLFSIGCAARCSAIVVSSSVRVVAPSTHRDDAACRTPGLVRTRHPHRSSGTDGLGWRPISTPHLSDRSGMSSGVVSSRFRLRVCAVRSSPVAERRLCGPLVTLDHSDHRIRNDAQTDLACISAAPAIILRRHLMQPRSIFLRFMTYNKRWLRVTSHLGLSDHADKAGPPALPARDGR